MGIKVPEQFRSEMAMAGDWNVVSRQTIDEPESEKPLNFGIKKRKYEGHEEEEEAGEAIVRRGWGATTRRFPTHAEADLDDLLSGSVTLGKKEKSDGPSITLQSNQHINPKEERGAVEPNDVTIPLASIEVSDGKFQQTLKKDGSPSVKDEPDGTSKLAFLDTTAEELPLPVFKKRRAKVS